MEILFILSLSLFFIAHKKVYEWCILSILGSRMDTPVGFLKNSTPYHVVPISLLILSGSLTFFIADGELWITGLVVTSIVWSLGSYFGKKKAFKVYRAGISEMIGTLEEDGDKKEYQDILDKSTDIYLNNEIKEKN